MNLLATGTSTKADAIVVGAGPTGAVAARFLAESGYNVTCLEQGDWVYPADLPSDKRHRDLLVEGPWNPNPNRRRGPSDYPCDVTESDVHPLMYNAVGGSTVLFGGEWPRFVPSDFRVKTLDGVAEDWPISYDDLVPYYELISEMIGVSGLPNDPAYPPGNIPSQPGIPIGKLGRQAAKGMNKLGWHWWPGTNAILSQPLDDRHACQRWGTCMSGCPEGAKASFDVAMWPAAIAAGVNLVTGARVREIETNESGLASAAVWIDRNGIEHRTSADVILLAANGVGTPRIMLMSASKRFPEGLANSSGLVGRRLMMHPLVGVLGIYDADLDSWLGPYGSEIYSLQFAETDRSRGFLRGAKWGANPIPGPQELMMRFAQEPLAARAGAQGQALLERAFGRSFEWYAIIEDLPDENNRVTLSSELTDSDGLPAPKLHYRTPPDSLLSMEWNTQRLREAHLAAGAIETHDINWMPEIGWHMLGTAVCGENPATSVVDGYGRSHDVPNLFVLDGSVFVTSSAVNPTPTATAFALRAVEHLVDARHDQKVPL